MSEKNQHWSIKVSREAIEIFGDDHVVCSGWSPSGVYHYGNSKEAITCNAFHKELLLANKRSIFIFVVDDVDPLNKVPQELKKYGKELREYMGHPINKIPDFTGNFDSYANYFAQGAIDAFERFGFEVEILYASDLYHAGRYDDTLREYIDKEEKLQTLIEGITGSRLASLINIVCESCGSISTPVIEKVEDEIYHYRCVSHKQFRGCDHVGQTKLEDHQWKLRWRLDWPARQRFLGVTIEPSGKDHSVQGGSVDTALAIHREIFEREPPILERFGFITIKGQKISGSKGGALQAKNISQIMPFSAYLFLNYRSDLLKDINFNPGTAEFANLIDEYDRGRKALRGIEVSGTQQEIKKLKVAAELAMNEIEEKVIPGNFKYAELILIYQVALRDIEKTLLKLNDKIVGEEGRDEVRARLKTIDQWLDSYAPSNMKFEFLDNNPDGLAQHWTDNLKKLWLDTLESVKDNFTEEEFTSRLRENASVAEIIPKEMYAPFYQMLTGTPRGPNAARLIQAFGRAKIHQRISDI